MRVKYVADSSIDFHHIEGIRFETAAVKYLVGNQEFVDDEHLNIEEMLTALEQHHGRSYTSCPDIDAWIKAYEDEEEIDVIYVLTLTSGLSCTYNSAVAAKQQFLESHPNVRIHVFDTLTTGPEMKLFLEKLIELNEAGYDDAEVVRRAQEYHSRTQLFFILRSVRNLAQNGRIPKAIAAIVGALNIRMLGIRSESGTIELAGKARGDKRMLKVLLEKLAALQYRGEKIRISHVQNEAYAKEVASLISDRFPAADIQIYPTTGVCAYYAERYAILIGFERAI